jgi:Flp pilus assembly protein TadG
MRVESVFRRLSATYGLAKRFARREDGAVAYFSLVIFFLMFLIGGMAVDLMRYEHTRVTLQQTMDRSVLAGASLQQTLSPSAVVSDYFAKAGLSAYLDASSIAVTQTLNSRNVKAKASAVSYNIFMDMLGVTELVAPAAAAAEQRRTNVEVVLVLDISGSMGEASGSTTKIAALKVAAKNFIDTVLANDTENRVSIAIVPYNAQVNMPAAVRAKYNFTFDHGVTNINCLEVPASTYSSLNMPRTLAMPMYSHADNTSGTTRNTSFQAVSKNGIGAQQCDPSTAPHLMLPSNDKIALKNKIDGLVAEGNTSIMLGMRWGVALLDPGARPMFNEFIGSGLISSNFTGRPFDYTDPDKMKVVVLMTDGEHVAHNIVKDPFKVGTSPIWRSTADGNFSIQHATGRPAAAGTNQFWVPHLCISTACKDATNTAEAWRATAWNSGGGATQQTWQQVWSNVRVQWVAWQLYARALGNSATDRDTKYNTAFNNMTGSYGSASTMNTMLSQSCTLAKGQGVVVYGIAFEAPTNGRTQISNCSSNPKSNHYFNATGLNISAVFQTIASNISQLRLTQ